MGWVRERGGGEEMTYSQRFRPDQVVSAVTRVMMAVRRRMRRMKE